MKLLVGNGRELIVRDVGPIVMTLRVRPGGVPIKFNGFVIVDDAVARARVRGFLDLDLYDVVKP